tara:strand:+ start:3727 stop:3987 length:261 start_codon:yes stop_codon:yes gene_type:complete
MNKTNHSHFHINDKFGIEINFTHNFGNGLLNVKIKDMDEECSDNEVQLKPYQVRRILSELSEYYGKENTLKLLLGEIYPSWELNDY